jgi:hypothetical protein
MVNESFARMRVVLTVGLRSQTKIATHPGIHAGYPRKTAVDSGVAMHLVMSLVRNVA